MLQAGKGKKQEISRTTITDADYADDIALLPNTPAQAESHLNSLERAAADRPPCQRTQDGIHVL